MARPLTVSFASSVAIQALNIMTGLLLARALGPQGRGELAVALLWPSLLAAVGSIGLAEATTYHAARRTAPLGTLVGTNLMIALLLSTLLVVAGGVILPFALARYGAGATQAARLFLAYIPLNLLALSFMAILNGQQRFSWFHGMRLLVMGGTSVSLLTFAFVGELTVKTAVIGYLVANLVTGIAAGALVFRTERIRLGFSARLTRQLLGFGIRGHTSSVSSLLSERLDQLLISLFLAPAMLGLYVVAVTLTSLTSLVGSSAAMVALPAVARLEEGQGRSATARHLVSLTLAASIAVTIPLLLFTSTLLDLFFGAAYGDAANVSRVLLVAAVLLSTNRVLAAVLKAVGRPLDTGVAEGVGLVCALAGLAWLLPTLGLMGAGIASLLAYGVSMGCLGYQASRALGLPFASMFFPAWHHLYRIAHFRRPLQVAVGPMIGGGER